MKKLILISAIGILIFELGCSDKKPVSINVENEKAKIDEVMNKGFEMGLKNDTNGMVNWARRHTLPQFHYANGNDIIFLNLDSLRKLDLDSMNSSQSQRLISYERDKSPIIKISSNGDMAYYLGKINFTMEFDSANTKLQKKFKGVMLQILEKKDTVWATGDYMSVHN